MKIDYKFYQKVENPDYLKRILYSDTDSLFLYVLTDEELKDRGYSFENKEETDRLEEDVVKSLGKTINNSIQNYWNKNLLPKMNIGDEWNTIDFKIEMMIDKIFFPGPKKRYIYRIHKKEGAYFDPPAIKFTGIEVKRSDAAEITKTYIKKFVNIMFNSNTIKETKKNLKELIKQLNKELKEIKDNYNLEYIGIPSSWSLKEYKEIPTYVYGAMLYNSLIQDICRPGTKGIRIHIQLNISKINSYLKTLKDPSQYQLTSKLFNEIKNKLNVIFLPPNFNKKKLIELEKQKFFKIDWKEQYNKVIKEKLDVFFDFIENLK